MGGKLNEQYFKTKKIHKENQSTKKLSSRKKIRNLIITIILISVYFILNKSCQERIDQNKKIDLLKNENKD